MSAEFDNAISILEEMLKNFDEVSNADVSIVPNWEFLFGKKQYKKFNENFVEKNQSKIKQIVSREFAHQSLMVLIVKNGVGLI